MKKNKKKTKRIIKIRAVVIFLLILMIIALLILKIINTHITNIYIKGNNFYNDEDIIKLAKLENYPTIIVANSLNIKKNLESDKLIRKVKVRRKRLLKEVYITVYENTPLFYYNNKTVLYNGQKVDKTYATPILVNEIDNSVYSEFLDCMRYVDLDVLDRISEIKYDPNDVDKERFYLTMNDGINVYVTLNKFSKINDYDEIIATLGSKKGTLYLDSGEYFEVKNE